MINPYARLFGPDWDRLPSVLRGAQTPPLKAVGNLNIQYGNGMLARALARVVSLPPEGNSIATTLDISIEGETVTWTRTFGEFRAISHHRFSEEGFFESAGPFRLLIRVYEKDGHAYHQQIRTYWGILRVPSLFGPQVYGVLKQGSEEDTWKVHVEIRHAWVGVLCKYEGEMRIQ